MLVSPEEKKLLCENPKFTFILYDWAGYGNDYTVEAGDLTFDELADEEYQVLSKFSSFVEHNRFAIEDLIARLKDNVENYKFIHDLGLE